MIRKHKNILEIITTNKTYSKKFKIKCVEAVMDGEFSVDDIIWVSVNPLDKKS